MHYRQQVTLTKWKAIVHVHSTTNSILFISAQQMQRVQDALHESLAECMGLTDGPILQTALNADCGLLPTRLQQAVELCSLHAKHLSVDQNRPAAQISQNTDECTPYSHSKSHWEHALRTHHAARHPNLHTRDILHDFIVYQKHTILTDTNTSVKFTALSLSGMHSANTSAHPEIIKRI